MKYNFDPSAFNPKVQELIEYYVGALEFAYDQDINDSCLDIHSVSKYLLTLKVTTKENLDPRETIITLYPLNEYQYTFQILISDKWPRRSPSKTT